MEPSWPGPRPASGGELAAEPGVGPPSVGNDEVPPRVGPDAGGAAGNDRVAWAANSGNPAGVPTAIARECAPTCAPPHALGNSGLEIWKAIVRNSYIVKNVLSIHGRDVM